MIRRLLIDPFFVWGHMSLMPDDEVSEVIAKCEEKHTHKNDTYK